ncbi:MAG: DUF6428 family protein [Bacteroidota bacterium]
MTTQAFIEILQTNPACPLYFEYQKGQFVRMDYHITEIKNVTYDTVDCGGVQNTWEDTIVQLWENAFPEPQHQVDTTKALKIFKVVEKVRPTFKDTELRFEYGNASFHTAILAVDSIKVTDIVTVHLVATNTTCKANDRATFHGLEMVCTPGGDCC